MVAPICKSWEVLSSPSRKEKYLSTRDIMHNCQVNTHWSPVFWEGPRKEDVRVITNLTRWKIALGHLMNQNRDTTFTRLQPSNNYVPWIFCLKKVFPGAKTVPQQCWHGCTFEGKWLLLFTHLFPLCVLPLTPAGLKFGTTGEEWSPTEKGDTCVDSSDGWDTGRSGWRTGVLVWGASLRFLWLFPSEPQAPHL